MIYLYYIHKFYEETNVKKLQKRYYILILIASVAASSIIHNFNSTTFEIVKNETVYAPESDIVEEEYEVNKVNINTADIRLLDTLDGIGEAMAKRIINYRTKNGKFEVIQDIMKVDGIGEKKFEAIREYITVE